MINKKKTKNIEETLIFLKYSLKFFIVILGIMYSFVLYQYIFGGGFTKSSFKEISWVNDPLILTLSFILSVEVYVLIYEKWIPKIDKIIKK